MSATAKCHLRQLAIVALGPLVCLLIAAPAWAATVSHAEQRRAHLLVHRGPVVAASHAAISGSHLGLYLVAALVVVAIAVIVALVWIWPARDAQRHAVAQVSSDQANRHAA
jgi:uncharacterized membrane protein